MKIAFFDAHRFDRESFEATNRDYGHSITYFEPKLNLASAPLAKGFRAVCSFVNDHLDRDTLGALRSQGVELISLRSAGTNHVDLQAAQQLGLKVVRVPAYSPHAVAEHAVALVLCLNRKIHRASARIHELNFSLDGLLGFDLFQKTVGVVGTGKIGAVFAQIMTGFGCRVLAYDVQPNPELLKTCSQIKYVELQELLRLSDIVSLHVPLTPQTRHMINAQTLALMKPGAMLINTGRGALVDSHDLAEGLKSRKIGAAGLDVYEEEENVFFQDLSDQVLTDDVLARLLTFPNVIITSHQAFFTKEALSNIAQTTLQNVTDFEKGILLKNEVSI